MALPMMAALPAEPLRVTSPSLASTLIEEDESSLSAWNLPFTIATRIASSLAPVGAPTRLSLLRTIVTERSRSAWISLPERRHSVMRVLRSLWLLVPVVAAAISVELRSVVLATPIDALPLGELRPLFSSVLFVVELRLGLELLRLGVARL